MTRSLWPLALLPLFCPAHAEPVRFAPEALGQDGKITLSPGFAPDGSLMVLAQSECGVIGDCPQRLKISRRSGDGWSAPELVERTKRGRADWPSVTPDGDAVLLSWAVRRSRHDGQDVYEDFDLYRLDLTDPEAEPVPIDEPDINRIRGGKIRQLRFVHNETAPLLTRSGDLWFWTERLDGPGERDIYIAPSDGNGGFLRARALGAPINTEGRDEHVWLSPDETLMLLSRTGQPGGEGDADIYLSRKDADGWTEPEPLGPSVNSPAADFAARITPDGRSLVFTSTRPFRDQPEGLLQVWSVPVTEIPALADFEPADFSPPAAQAPY